MFQRIRQAGTAKMSKEHRLLSEQQRQPATCALPLPSQTLRAIVAVGSVLVGAFAAVATVLLLFALVSGFRNGVLAPSFAPIVAIHFTGVPGNDITSAEKEVR